LRLPTDEPRLTVRLENAREALPEWLTYMVNEPPYWSHGIMAGIFGEASGKLLVNGQRRSVSETRRTTTPEL